MAKTKGLLARVIALSTIALEFSSMAITVASDGSRVAILQLKMPLAEPVRGSQEIQYEGVSHPLVVEGCTEVKVHESNMEDAGFETDDVTGEITYKGDGLSLDVAKSTKQVWLVSEKFSSVGQNARKEATSNRLAALLGLAKPAPGANGPVNASTPAPVVVNTNVAKEQMAGG